MSLWEPNLTGIRANTRLATIDPDTGLSTGRFAGQHNTEDKTFSAVSTTAPSKALNQWMKCQENLKNMWWSFSKIETARLYCRRLYRYFISSNITLKLNSISSIHWRSNWWIIIMRQLSSKTLITSVHFYDEDDSDNKDEIIGALIKALWNSFLAV